MPQEKLNKRIRDMFYYLRHKVYPILKTTVGKYSVIIVTCQITEAARPLRKDYN